MASFIRHLFVSPPLLRGLSSTRNKSLVKEKELIVALLCCRYFFALLIVTPSGVMVEFTFNVLI